jgi:hypothetical protein
MMGGFPPRRAEDAAEAAPGAPTYVLTDVEVRLTGRRARKPAPAAGTRAPTAELVEVTPIDPNNGTWKKWVPRGALFEILPGEAPK